jgi:hypothetical protein
MIQGSPVKKKLESWMKHTPDPICSGCITHKKRPLDRSILNQSSENSRGRIERDQAHQKSTSLFNNIFKISSEVKEKN